MVHSQKKMSMENKEAAQPRPIKRIDNERDRKAAFKNRKGTLKKKTMELSILCDIKACTICLGPNGEVDTWPENPSDVKAVIEMYKEKGNQGQIRQKVQLSDVLDDKVQKAEKQIDAMKKECFKKVIPDWDECLLDGLSMESLLELMSRFDSKMEAVNSRIEFLKSTREEKNGDQGKETVVFDKDFGSVSNQLADCWFDIDGMGDLALVDELYQPIQTYGSYNFDDQMPIDLSPWQGFQDFGSSSNQLPDSRFDIDATMDGLAIADELFQPNGSNNFDVQMPFDLPPWQAFDEF